MRIHPSALPQAYTPSNRFVAPAIAGGGCLASVTKAEDVGPSTPYPVSGRLQEMSRLYWLPSKLVIRKGSYARFVNLASGTPSVTEVTFTFGPAVSNHRGVSFPYELACPKGLSIACLSNEENPPNRTAQAGLSIGHAPVTFGTSDLRELGKTVYWPVIAGVSSYIVEGSSTVPATSILPPLSTRVTEGMVYVNAGIAEIDFSDQNGLDPLPNANYVHSIPLYASYPEGFTGFAPNGVLLKFACVPWHFKGESIPPDTGAAELEE